MQLPNSTLILAAVYVAVIAVGGVAAGVTSASAWVSLGALALLPACSMLVVWSQRPHTPVAGGATMTRV
jgi:hypothetical protein